jgi:hypothetical protein
MKACTLLILAGVLALTWTSFPSAQTPSAGRGKASMDIEEEDRGREHKIVSGGDENAGASKSAGPLTPVSLRSRPADLSGGDVRELLVENGFYAACWTYNADFCNPEGEFKNNFKDNGDGTITDGRTRLMWRKGCSDLMSWTEAGAHVERLNRERFAGHGDWRLPTVEELASLMENAWLNGDLFLAPVFDGDGKYFWSADTKGLQRAWKGNFHLGFFLDFPISDLSAIKAVRGLR